MADRVSVTIKLGGTIARALIDELVDIINEEGLSVEWDGEPITSAQIANGHTLKLCAHEVAWGTLDILEPFCHTHNLPYARWYSSYQSCWSGGRNVYRGVDMLAALDTADQNTHHAVGKYLASDEDDITIDIDTVESLGSYDAILNYFAEANFTVPPLVIVEVTAPVQMATTACQA